MSLLSFVLSQVLCFFFSLSQLYFDLILLSLKNFSWENVVNCEMRFKDIAGY